MTDRRDGFPPTPASSLAPLHDGGSEQDRAKAHSVLDEMSVLMMSTATFDNASLAEPIAQAIADARRKTASEIADMVSQEGERATFGLVRDQLRQCADAIRSKYHGTESPSYQRSSEGTRAGGQQTPTQNEGE